MTGRAHTVIDSPVGPLTLVASDGALCGLYMDEQRHRPDAETFGPSDVTLFTEVIDQLHAYFDGQRSRFEVPMAMVGTAFQRSVWDALRDIPYGHTVSYGQLAGRIGNPAASRAVGLANGRNPIGIIVPCHRVVGSTGQLTGYGGGLERKQFLLDFERSHRSEGRSALGGKRRR
jgi:methylated-DNA-[protein]-cysteine S-methyltransferase